MIEPNPLLDADYAAIECRIVNWVAGQDDVLDRFRAYDAAETPEEKHALDPYRIQASSIFGVPVSEVNKFPQRYVGKSSELGCGFGMGPPKFRSSCLKQGKYVLPDGLEFVAVETYRKTHKKVQKLWYDVEDCAKKAIARKGDTIKLRNIAFKCIETGGMEFLLIRLPSGRKLSYPQPRISGKRIVHLGLIIGTQWGDVDTYGGKLVENIVQAIAADIMANGAHKAEGDGFEIATLIHDQALAFYRDELTPEHFVACLTDLPSWADGLPIQAEGGLVPFYKKD